LIPEESEVCIYAKRRGDQSRMQKLSQWSE
jgi:hypothetical protein